MPDQTHKTEKSTPSRRTQARQRGHFPVSPEFVFAIRFLGVVCIGEVWGMQLLSAIAQYSRAAFREAFHAQIGPATPLRFFREALFGVFAPCLWAGAGLLVLTLAAQLAVTRMGFAWHRVSPDLSRLNPAARWPSVFKQGLSSAGQALILLPILSFAVFQVAGQSFPKLLNLTGLPLLQSLTLIAAIYRNLFFEAAFLLLLFGLVSLLRQRALYEKSLRMSKQEVRDERREQEGSPEWKLRRQGIHRLLGQTPVPGGRI